MPKKENATTEATPETATPEVKKERKPKDVQYGTRMVITFRAHKTVKDLPNIVPGILTWAESKGMVAEAETITTTQKSGKKTAKGEALKFPKVEVTFDTKDSYANRKSSTAGVSRELVGAMRALVNDEAVIAKAKESGMSVEDLVKKALAGIK